MARLKERCRTVLQLRYIEEKSLNEIKEQLKVPLGTVATRLMRCQEALKRIATREA